MIKYNCERHNCQQSQVLQDDKLVLYCPECSKLNIVKIVQLEEKIEFSNKKIDSNRIEKRKKTLYIQFLLGLTIAFYLQITPWFFTPLFKQIDSVGNYFSAVFYSYAWLWTNEYLSVISIILLLIGFFSVKDAAGKIRKLPQTKTLNRLTPKDVTFALKQFQSSNRLDIAKSYLQKLHKKYAEQKTTVIPVEVMTEYELTLYYAKLLQHLKFTNVQLKVPNDNFGISLIGTRDNVKTAFMVVKDVERLLTKNITLFGTGRAYFDCDEAIILADTNFSNEMQQEFTKLILSSWNMKEVRDQITSDTVDEWVTYLDGYLIQTDIDLANYTIYEQQRLIHLNNFEEVLID